jgi:hypothetical protein
MDRLQHTLTFMPQIHATWDISRGLYTAGDICYGWAFPVLPHHAPFQVVMLSGPTAQVYVYKPGT